MFQSYKYGFLSLIRNKEHLFWALLFPLLLGTFFYLSFGNMLELENFSQIPVAIVEDTDTSTLAEYFNEMINELSDGNDALISPQFLSLTEANEQLDDGKIDGIFQLGDEVTLIVAEEGINQSILQSISNRFLQISSTMGNIASVQPDMLEQAMADISGDIQINQEITLGAEKTHFMVYMFYTVLAMACFMSADIGFQKAINIQADTSALAVRRSVSSTRKIMLIISDYLAAVSVQFLLSLVSMLYFVFVLNVNFGEQLGMVILTNLVGCIVGVSVGTFFATVVKGSINTRQGLLTGVSLLLYFLSGLMGIDIRFAIREHAPILDKLNPVTLLSDAYFSLAVYDNFHQYFRIIGTLLLIAVFFCIASATVLRRKRYARI